MIDPDNASRIGWGVFWGLCSIGCWLAKDWLLGSIAAGACAYLAAKVFL